MSGLGARLLCALGLLVALPSAQEPGADDPLAVIDLGRGNDWRAAFDELVAAGEPAARRALVDFQAQAFAARRARAQLVIEVGSAGLLERVLTLLDDPDPDVRASWAVLLGNPSLGVALASERTEALLDYAATDPDRGVRSQAIEALARSALPGTVTALDGLLDRLPPDEAVEVALAMARFPSAERRLVGRVQAAFLPPSKAQARRLDADVLAALLTGYGRALADLPRGGESPVDRVPFALGLRHPSLVVQAATRNALNTCVTRLLQFAQYDRADAFLARVSEEGWDTQDLLYRRAGMALSQRGNPEASLQLALALERSAEEAPIEDVLMWRFYGVQLQGASLFAQGEFPAARQAFERAAVVLQELLGERLDLSAERRGPSAMGGAIMADRLLLLSLTELWQGLCVLAQDRAPAAPAFLEELRLAHELLLQARVMAYASDALDGFPVETLDALLERNLGPWALVLSNPRLPVWGDGRGLDLMLQLGRGLATVAPWEMPGFEPLSVSDVRLTDPLSDPRRLAALGSVREEHYRWLGRRRDEISQRSANLGVIRPPSVERQFNLQRRDIEYRLNEERRQLDALGAGATLDPAQRYELYSHLVSYLSPSLFALTVGATLRVEGRLADARGLGKRMLADLRVSRPGQGQIGSEWASARAELMLGSTYMDEDDPKEAERHVLEAVRRLEALENTLTEQRTRVDQGLGDSAGLEASIRQTREMRANALLSLAVNANVRLGDTELALRYFEQAYALDQRDFMRVLLACYRARSGRAAEARAVLRGIKATPPLYYNLACTHALMGEVDQALDYLQRELLENHPSRGSLERQKGWAREDPDLRALRDDPRFQRMVAAHKGP